MASLNKVTLIGNLGNDPDVRNTQAGGQITTISIATTEKWKDKDGNPQERTEWHRVKFFGRLAEIASEYLKKGSQVYIEGSLRTEKYTDKEGVEKYSTDIVAAEMKMLGGKRENDGEERPARQGAPAPARAAGGGGGGQRPAARPGVGPGGGGQNRGALAAASNSGDDFGNDIPFMASPASTTW